MTDLQPTNHLNNSFYVNAPFVHQMMTSKQWRETALQTNGHIIANGRTYELYSESRGGGMYEIKARLLNWKNDKPVKKEETHR